MAESNLQKHLPKRLIESITQDICGAPKELQDQCGTLGFVFLLEENKGLSYLISGFVVSVQLRYGFKSVFGRNCSNVQYSCLTVSDTINLDLLFKLLPITSGWQ